MKAIIVTAIGVAIAVAKPSILLLHERTVPEKLTGWLNRDHSPFTLTTSTGDNLNLVDTLGEGIHVDNLIILGGKLPKSTTTEMFVEYAKRGGNILWVLPDDEQGSLDAKTIRLAGEFGRELDSKPPIVIDYTGKGGDPADISVSFVKDTANRVLPNNNGRAIYRGHVHRIQTANPLVFPVITARKEATSQCPNDVSMDKCVASYGTDNVIVSALQSRINSRITMVSGMGWFKEANEIATDLIMWTFQRTGQLILHEYKHYSLEGRTDDRGYRIGDRMELKVCLKDESGRPVQPVDMQMELVMLDAWLRADLHPIGDCLSTGPVLLPDRYGTYSLKVRYQRRGWPHLIKSEKFIIRPVHHDEVIRFLPSALPYYAAWFSMMITSVFIIWPFIFPTDRKPVKK